RLAVDAEFDVARLGARQVAQDDDVDPVDQRDDAARLVLVDEHRVRGVLLPAGERRDERPTRDGRVDDVPVAVRRHEDAHALVERVERRRVRVREGDLALELEAVIPGARVEARHGDRRLRREHRDDVVARVAGVALAVVVRVLLPRVGDGRTIVDVVAEAVAVGVLDSRIRRACSAGAVARLGRITAAGRCPADEPARPQRVARTVDARAVAVFRDVAAAGHRPAHGARRRAGIRRTVVGGAVAALRRVAGPGRRTADRGALRIGRACRVRPRAVLGHVADTGRGTAHGPAVARRMLAGVAGAVALIQGAGVAVAGAGGSRRALPVGGAVRSVPRADLRRVALSGRGAALREGGLEAVCRTRCARAGAVLDVVARAGRRTAHRARVPGRMLAGVAAAVALIQAARVPVARARRSGGLLRIGRTGRARARARVGEVAFTRARTAGRAGVAG